MKRTPARREHHGRRSAHDAAFAAGHVRLERWHRRSIYTSLGVLAGSGLLWLLFHYFVRVQTEWGEGPHPLETWWLRLHGLAAMLTLIALGSLLLTHLRRAWRLGRNRASGAVLSAVLVLLILTGYALYYFGSEQSRPAISLVHWLFGLATVPLLVAHVALGRGVRGEQRRTRSHRPAPRRLPAEPIDERRLHAEALVPSGGADGILAGPVPGGLNQ